MQMRALISSFETCTSAQKRAKQPFISEKLGQLRQETGPASNSCGRMRQGHRTDQTPQGQMKQTAVASRVHLMAPLCSGKDWPWFRDFH